MSIDDYVCTNNLLLLYTKFAAVEVWFGKRTGRLYRVLAYKTRTVLSPDINNYGYH